MTHPPGDGLPPASRAAFEQLRARFLAGLAQRWQELSSAADETAQQAALHRLAGVAGSFGYEALGEAARRAEGCALAGDAAGLAAALEGLRRHLADAGVTV